MTSTPTAGPLAALWQGGAPRRPRPLPVPPASDRTWWDLETGRADRATREALLAAAREDLAAPWPAIPASLAMQVHRNGARDPYERALRARQERLSRAVVAAASTLDPTWIDQAIDGVVLLCEQTTWCWPAHDEAGWGRGEHLGDPDRPTLDLGAGEVAAQLAWVDHLLGDELDAAAPGLRRRIRREVEVRVLRPFRERRDWGWLGTPDDVHNWNPWILGNILVAATALAPRPDEAATTVGRALDALDTFVQALPADGAIDEGHGYWWNGACRALEAIALVDECWGGLDARGIPALRATVDFPACMHLGGDWFLAVADGQARPPAHAPWHALHRAARTLGATDAQVFAIARGRRLPAVADATDGLGRLLLALTDPGWTEARPSGEPLPRDVWLPSIGLGLARARAGSPAGLALGFKGGHNGEHHNHLDVGSVTVAIDGCPVIVDPGRPTYTAQTFSAQRYEIWTMQSAWHSAPAPRGAEQGMGRAFAAHDARVEADDARTTFRADLAPAYPAGTAARWTRTATLDRSAGAVTVADEWEAAPDPTGALPAGTTRWMLAGAVDGTGTGATVTSLDGRTVRLRWTGAVLAALDTVACDDPMLAEVWGDSLTRLTLAAPDDATRGTMILTVGPA